MVGAGGNLAPVELNTLKPQEHPQFSDLFGLRSAILDLFTWAVPQLATKYFVKWFFLSLHVKKIWVKCMHKNYCLVYALICVKYCRVSCCFVVLLPLPPNICQLVMYAGIRNSACSKFYFAQYSLLEDVKRGWVSNKYSLTPDTEILIFIVLLSTLKCYLACWCLKYRGNGCAKIASNNGKELYKTRWWRSRGDNADLCHVIIGGLSVMKTVRLVPTYRVNTCPYMEVLATVRRWPSRPHMIIRSPALSDFKGCCRPRRAHLAELLATSQSTNHVAKQPHTLLLTYNAVVQESAPSPTKDTAETRNVIDVK